MDELSDIIKLVYEQVAIHDDISLSLTSFNKYIDNDPEFHSMNQLLLLEEGIKDKIHRTKNNIHETHSRAYTDSLLIEIETLNWVLNEITGLSRKE
ncbi:MAG: hypothetical protein WAM14_01140 [Candidatus Nitrosopolaris sp.]